MKKIAERLGERMTAMVISGAQNTTGRKNPLFFLPVVVLTEPNQASYAATFVFTGSSTLVGVARVPATLAVLVHFLPAHGCHRK